jgi:hypothetical protein
MSANPWQIERLWPDPATGPFRLRLAFGQVDGRVAVTAVELRGVAPAQPWPTDLPGLPDAAVRAADIRLPLGQLLDTWTALTLSRARASRTLWPANEESVQRFERQEGVRRSGRPSLSAEFLRQVAEVYKAAVAAGDRAPALAVGKELRANTPETARDWVHKARKRGFIPPSTRTTTT